MFGMVLAIGLLVDDAIVVVKTLSVLWRKKVCRQKKPPVIDGADSGRSGRYRDGTVGGIVPMAFFGGSTGAIYRQFSITLFQQWRCRYWWR